MNSIKYIGMDVHKETISIAVVNSVGKVVMESIIETKAITTDREPRRPLSDWTSPLDLKNALRFINMGTTSTASSEILLSNKAVYLAQERCATRDHGNGPHAAMHLISHVRRPEE